MWPWTKFESLQGIRWNMSVSLDTFPVQSALLLWRWFTVISESLYKAHHIIIFLIMAALRQVSWSDFRNRAELHSFGVLVDSKLNTIFLLDGYIYSMKVQCNCYAWLNRLALSGSLLPPCFIYGSPGWPSSELEEPSVPLQQGAPLITRGRQHIGPCSCGSSQTDIVRTWNHAVIVMSYHQIHCKSIICSNAQYDYFLDLRRLQCSNHYFVPPNLSFHPKPPGAIHTQLLSRIPTSDEGN